MRSDFKYQSSYRGVKYHRCYYGYTKTPWYRPVCATCGKTLKFNLAVLSCLATLVVAGGTLTFYLFL